MRISTLLLIIPVVVAAGVIAVANRADVTFSFDPFSADEPAAALTLPLYATVFLTFLLGVLVGGGAVWWRRAIASRRSRARDIAKID